MDILIYLGVGLLVLGIVNKICEDRPAVRHVLCCIISLVYPIGTIATGGNLVWLIVGAVLVGFYKFVYGMAEIIENDDETMDLLAPIIINLSHDGEINVIAIVVSVIISVAFAALAIVPIAVFMDWEALFLAYAWLFIPFIYCLISAIRYFRENY